MVTNVQEVARNKSLWLYLLLITASYLSYYTNCAVRHLLWSTWFTLPLVVQAPLYYCFLTVYSILKYISQFSVLRITVFFELILLYTFIHRILGYIAGYLIRSKLDPEKTGKFNIHIEWISFRVGLDWNQVVIHGIEWRNPPGFNAGKHKFLLSIAEVSLAIDVLSVYRAVTTYSSIHINSFIISDVDIHIKRHSNNNNNTLNGNEPLLFRDGVLNFSAAVGAVDEVEEHSMMEQIGDHLSDVMGTSIYMMGVMTDAVVKYNPFTVLKKTATYIGKSFRSLLRKSSNLHSHTMISEMMDAHKSEEELQALFRKYDRDCSGFLDKDELREVLYASNSAVTDGEVEAILSMLDSSGDGRITYEEFSLWWKNKDKRGIDLKEALASDEESSKADDYLKNKHEAALLGIPYRFEIDNLQIIQLVLDADSLLTAHQTKGSRFTRIRLPLFNMFRVDLTLPPRRAKKVNRKRRGIYLDDVMWRVVSKLVRVLIYENTISMMLLLSASTAKNLTHATIGNESTAAGKFTRKAKK